jgi:hypothetical protein
MVRNSVRSSIAIARSTTSTFSPHCHTESPAVAPSTTSVSAGTAERRIHGARIKPTSSTTHAPAVSASSGDSAAQSIVGAFSSVTAPPPPPGAPPP